MRAPIPQSSGFGLARFLRGAAFSGVRTHVPSPLSFGKVQVADVSAAIVAAANVAWPPRTIGLRTLDGEGREVFRRQKSDRRKG